MRKIINAIGLREIVWVIILVIVVITTAISVNKLNEKVENLTKFMAYERINDLGYFQKLSEKMSYADGQIECSKIFGHIVEFKWDGSKCGFIFKCKYFSIVRSSRAGSCANDFQTERIMALNKKLKVPIYFQFFLFSATILSV